MDWAVSAVHVRAEQNFSSTARRSSHRSPPAEIHGIVLSAERRKLFFAHVSYTEIMVHLRTSFDHSSYIHLFHSSVRSHQQLQKYFTPCELGLLNGSINDLKPEVHPHNIGTLNFYFTPNTWIPMTNKIWVTLFKDITVFGSVYTKQIHRERQ